MGYVSRTGDGDGDYFPRVASIPHVADANARLSLDPTGKVAGYQVIQDDNSTTYTFNGDGSDADAGLWVTGAGFSDYDGAYSFDGTLYAQIGGVGHTVDTALGPWAFHSDPDYIGVGTPSYAWLTDSWTANNGADPAPTVARNPIASTSNWTP